MIALTASLRLRAVPRDSQPVTLRSLLAGLGFVFRTDLILATITLDMLAVFLGGATALLPIYARDILGIGPTGLGWLRAAPSIGSFLTALVLAHRPPMRQAGKSLLWAVAGFGVATIVFGLSTDPYLSFAMLLLTGAFDNISVVVRSTLVQLLTPDEMRGRVSAINAIFIASSNELGEFESGVAARSSARLARWLAEASARCSSYSSWPRSGRTFRGSVRCMTWMAARERTRPWDSKWTRTNARWRPSVERCAFLPGKTHCALRGISEQSVWHARASAHLKRCSSKDFKQVAIVPTTTSPFHDKACAVGMLLQE